MAATGRAPKNIVVFEPATCRRAVLAWSPEGTLMKSMPVPPGRSRSRVYRRMLAAGVAALALVAAGCSSSSSSSTSSGATAVQGGTATWAEPPSSTPTYIFPYMNSANISNLNLFDFQYLMYRPLYWFGTGDKPTVNTSLSLANLPTVSGRTVTITLKPYMWSNGTQVTAQDVMFWLNMELAEPANYGAYTGFPTNVSDIKVVSPTTLTMVMNQPYSLTWFLYNADGHVTFVPNKSYSGPVKPKLAAFQEVPFTTDAAEYDVLRSPSSGSQIDFGYLPDQDAPAKPANAAVGANPLSGYTLAPVYPWGIDYYALNFQSTVSDHAAIIKQLYFRQVMAYLMNQASIVQGPLRGYGAVTVGPVAATPPTQWLSATGRQGDPFPYNPGKAKSLLASHGWTVVPGGTTTCTNPSLCGPGITNGTALNFSFVFESGVSWVLSEMDQLQSSASQVGIKLNLVPKPFADVISQAGGNCVVTKVPCNWDMANWGFGWSFSPDYLPTGEELFMCGAVANSGGYCDKSNDTMIEQTLTSSNLQYMYSWQDYLAPQVPVEYQPNAAYTLSEIANNLKGVLPQSPTLSITPEYWYFVS